MMNIEEVLEKMKELGDHRAIAIWEKMGMGSSQYYGVNLTKLIVVDYGETSYVTPDPIKHFESKRVLVKLAND